MSRCRLEIHFLLLKGCFYLILVTFGPPVGMATLNTVSSGLKLRLSTTLISQG